MKRFYKTATAQPTDQGYGLFLDGKPMRTPARQPLVLPNLALASAIANEWQSQGEAIKPDTMPLTQLASTAQDRMSLHDVPPPQESERRKAVRILAEYAATDLLCYRSDNQGLSVRQAKAWQPWLDWAAEDQGLRLAITDGVMPIAQSAESLARVGDILDSMDDWQLTGFMVLCPGLGSFVLALAVLHGALDVDLAVDAAQIEEGYQLEIWGGDAEAEAAMAAKRADMKGAAHFLRLLQTA